MINLIQKYSLEGFRKANLIETEYEIQGAFKAVKIIGIWDSDVLDGTEFLLIWKSIEWTATTYGPDDRVYIFIRSGDSDDLSSVEWSGPVSESISHTNRYIQIRIAIVGTTPVDSQYPTYQSDKVGPTVDRIIIKATTSSTSSIFFSKTFDLGFYPKSIVATLESDVPEGSILRFGVTSLDSVNKEDYQFIDENRVVELDELSVTGRKIKFMIEMSGNSSDEVVIHEFAAIFGGDDNSKLNQ
jgi:hypothetical protein